MLCFADGMMGYLYRAGVLLKEFGEHAQAMTGRLIEASLAAAEEAQRPIEYLPSPKTRKDEYARNIALDDDIQDGLICLLTCVEPCKTYEIYFPFRSASTAGSGSRDAWTKPACNTIATRTVFLGLTTSPRPKGSWIGCTRSTGPECSTPWQEH